MEKNNEILKISEDILTDFELNRLPLEQVIMKCKRLARLQNDFESLKWFELELNGYSQVSLPSGITLSDAERLAWRSGRFEEKEEVDFDAVIKDVGSKAGVEDKKKDGLLPKKKNYYYKIESISQLETDVASLVEQLRNIKTPAQYTPTITRHESGTQGFLAGMVNEHVHEKYADVIQKVSIEQNRIAGQIKNKKAILARIRSHISTYVLHINYQYQFSGIVDTVFENCKKLVESKLVEKCPDAIKELVAAYDRLPSAKPEEWAQAITSCRRFLKDFSDTIFPAQQEQYCDQSGNKHEVAYSGA